MWPGVSEAPLPNTAIWPFASEARSVIAMKAASASGCEMPAASVFASTNPPAAMTAAK